MNLLCPNCQKMLSVEEQRAGQMMRCPLCNGTFTVPALPGAATVAQVPANPPLPGSSTASVPPPAATHSATLSPPANPKIPATDEVYAVSPPPAPPPGPAPLPPSPAWERPPKPEPVPAEPGPAAAESPTLPSAPPGYAHAFSLTLSPRIVPWIAPAALGLLVVLLSFTWVGRYSPSGPETVTEITQSGWGTGFSKDFGVQGLLHHLLFLLVVLPVTLAVILVPQLGVQLPPQVKQVWPFRLYVLGGALLLLILLLSLQILLTGFGLEVAADKPGETATKEGAKPAASTPPDPRVEALAKRTVYRTWAVYLALLLEVAALGGVGLDYWLQHRGDRPLPRLDVAW